MKTILAIIFWSLLYGCQPCPAMDRLAALSQIESGNNDHARGRAGEVSRWQILKSVWRAHTSLPYSAATNAITAQAVALAVLAERVTAFSAKHGRQPTDAEIYLLWNPKAAHSTAQRFANLCQAP